jgi:hypothetical protein
VSSTINAAGPAKPPRLVENVAAPTRHGGGSIALTGTLTGLILGVFAVVIVSGYWQAGAAATRREAATRGEPAHRHTARHRKPAPGR